MIDEKDIKNEAMVEEVPTIVIEKIDGETLTAPEPVNEVKVITSAPVARWKIWVPVGVIIVLLLVICWLLLYLRPIPTAPVVPVSQTAEESIEQLQQPLNQQERHERAGVTCREDSIYGVLFREYTLTGLRAELSFDEPSPADKSVYFYTHSADYRGDNGQVLDACIVKGEQVSEGSNRSGYLAAVGNRTLIGNTYSDSIQNFVLAQGGYFFRQFALVSAGQQCDIRLKGKVERRAIGRRGTQLFYVESINPESLYDFAQALCDYGYTDAIYITGGNAYSFYRDQQGKCHDIGTDRHQPMKAAKAPFLIFKKR